MSKAPEDLAGTPYEGGVPNDETFGLDEQDLRDKYSYSGRVMEKLEALGFTTTVKPKVSAQMASILDDLEEGQYFNGRLPQSLSRLSLEDLSDLHVLFTNWMHYITVTLNEVIVARSEVDAKKSAIWSMVRMKHLKDAKKHIGMNLTDQRQSDLARYDLRFVDANQEYVELTALRNCLESLQKLAEANTNVVSREVTRREIALNAETRGRNIEGREIGRFNQRGGRSMSEAGKKTRGVKRTTARPGR